MAGKVSFTFLVLLYTCKVTDKCTFSYRKRNDEKTPGKLSDTNDEADSSGNRVKKFRTKKPCWSTDPQQENQQQGEEINRHRRGKGSIAKSLHYGVESSSDEAQSIPLYRLVAPLISCINRLDVTYLLSLIESFAKPWNRLLLVVPHSSGRQSIITTRTNLSELVRHL